MSTAVYKNTGHSNTFTRLFQALLGRCLNYWLQGPNMHGASNDHKDLSNGAQSVERRALGDQVVGMNQPAIPEVTLDGHSCGSLTIPRCKIGPGLGLGIQS